MSMTDQNHVLPDVIHLDTTGDMTYLDPFSISKWNNEKIFELSSAQCYLCSINSDWDSKQQEISTDIDFPEDVIQHNFYQTITTNKNLSQRLSPIPEIRDNDFSENDDTKQKAIENSNSSNALHISENKSIKESSCAFNRSCNESCVSPFPESSHAVHEASKTPNDTSHISTINEISNSPPPVSYLNSHFGKISISNSEKTLFE